MNTLNIIGRISNDVTLRESKEDKKFVTFTIAYNEFNKTYFFECIAWDKIALFIKNYFSKGQRIAITGKLTQSQYEREGNKISKTTIVVNSADFIEPKQPLKLS